MDWSHLVPVLQIIGIDLVLSGDNAVVIAMASHRLPPQQRKLAFMLGAGGAIVLRIIATIGVTYLLRVPLLLFGGGAMLTVIALKLLIEEEAAEHHIGAAETLAHAIKTIMVADFIMSLDNMLAVAGAGREHPGLIVFGLLFSIAIIMTGSAIISELMNKYPILISIGAGILGWTAGHMMAGDEVIVRLARAYLSVDLHHAPLSLVVPAVVVVMVVTAPRWWPLLRKSTVADAPPAHEADGTPDGVTPGALPEQD